MSDSFSRRRSSYNIEYVKAPKGGGSASKVGNYFEYLPFCGRKQNIPSENPSLIVFEVI